VTFLRRLNNSSPGFQSLSWYDLTEWKFGAHPPLKAHADMKFFLLALGLSTLMLVHGQEEEYVCRPCGCDNNKYINRSTCHDLSVCDYNTKCNAVADTCGKVKITSRNQADTDLTSESCGTTTCDVNEDRELYNWAQDGSRIAKSDIDYAS